MAEEKAIRPAQQEEGEKIPIEATDSLLDFEDNDPTNPLNWSKTYKWSIVILAALLNAMVYVLSPPSLSISLS
jgi:hypothetical protein